MSTQQTATQTTKKLNMCAGVYISTRSSVETSLRQCRLQELHYFPIEDRAVVPDTRSFEKLAMNEDALRTAIKW